MEKSNVAENVRLDAEMNGSLPKMSLIYSATPTTEKGSYTTLRWRLRSIDSAMNRPFTRSLWLDRVLFWGLWLCLLALALTLSSHIQSR